MAKGVENEYAVLWQASGDLLAASDYYGHLLAAMDLFCTDEKMNVVYVPA